VSIVRGMRPFEAENRAKRRLPKDASLRGSQTPGVLRILVAEDNRVNQRMVTALLQKMGHVFVVAENGREAVEMLRTSDFDLILMDWQMPIMDGLQATSAIRAAEKDTGDHIPIIAMTAYSMPGDQEMCMAAGMDGYLSKPISREALTRVLDDIAPTWAASAEETANIPYGQQPAKTRSER
jgi:two-component system sensor histidine kinase/response regulator